MIAIVSDYVAGMTLSELNENKDHLNIPKELGIFVYTALLNIIEKADEEGIVLNILPDSVLLFKQEQV